MAQRYLDSVADVEQKLVISKRDKETLLKSPLVCLYCDNEFGNMPQLKTHLAEEFKQQRARHKR